MKLLTSLVLLVGLAAIVSAQEEEEEYTLAPSYLGIPEKFFGLFELEMDKTVDFDDYLIAKGYTAVMRALAHALKMSLSLERGTRPDTLKVKHITWFRTLEMDNIILGVPFRIFGLDLFIYTIRITYDPVEDEIVESRIRAGAPETDRETTHYKIVENNLVVKMRTKHAVAMQFYKRV